MLKNCSMNESAIGHIFLFLIGTSVLNFIVAVLARIKTKHKEFNNLIAYWPSVIFSFVVAAILRNNPTEIAFAYFFQAISSNLYVQMLSRSLSLKTNWMKHLSIQAMAMLVSGYLILKTQVGFTYSLLPLCAAFSLPFYRPIWHALVKAKDKSNWIEKSMAYIFISAVVHHFNMAFFRLDPNAEAWGWSLTIAHYQLMSILLPMLINHRREETERKNLKQAIEKISGRNVIPAKSEELYKQLEFQISQKEYFYNQLQASNTHLEEEREMNEVLIRTISHDLANPLTVIGAYTEMLHSKQILPEDTEKIWERLKTNTQSALDMVGRIRNAILTRTQASLVAVHDVIIDRCMRRVMDSFDASLKKKQLKIVYRNKTSPGTLILAEENALTEHIFANVLSNAIKFSYPGSIIEISVKDAGESVQVEFRDHGTGIQVSRLEKRLLMSTPGTSGEPGTGFGLMVMGYFLRKFGATLDMKSETEGENKGTTVIINLKKSDTYNSIQLASKESSANIYS